MHVAIDARPLQLDAYRERGIGGHLRGWIGAAQALKTDFAFSLLFDPALPMPSLGLESEQWRLLPLALPFFRYDSNPAILHVDKDEELIFDSALEAFLLEQRIDLLHTTYPFMWEAFVCRRLHSVKSVVTIYDLIPLVFREEYLDLLGDQARASFAQRLGATVYARQILTISQSSKQDLIKFAQIDPQKIDVVYSGIDARFAPMPKSRAQQVVSALGIDPPYILSVSGFHHTKNLRRLLEAYSLLPNSLRKIYRLVVVCPLSYSAQETVQKWLDHFGVQGRVIFLQDVSQEQVVALYNSATVLAHPTLYEGFGLPILEAMRCGTPVVTSTVSSMPEIAGDAAVLVNPSDSQDIAQGIAQVLSSSDLQAEMRTKGFLQALPFTWQRTAQAILNTYEKIAETRREPTPIYQAHRLNRRLRLSFWSPLNPRPSGVSDYSESLIAALSEHAEVHVFLDGYQPANLPLFDTVPMFDARAYPYLARHHPYDMNLYQVGNNPLHRYMYKPIFDHPGIVTFHDTCLYHLVHAVLALGDNPDHFWEEVTYDVGAEIAQRARIAYVKGELDDYSLPLNKRLVEASRGVVVHSEWAASQIRRNESMPPLRVIPFGMTILEDDGGRFGRLVRRLLGLPEHGFIFGVFGNIHRVKRMSVVLRAFDRLHREIPDTALLVMGPVDSSAANDFRALGQNSHAARMQGVYLDLNYASYDRMLMAMQAVDVGINLRYPTAGETSGTLSMLLGQGKPTIVSEVGSFSEYPDSCCPKVPLGESEEDILFRHLITLATDKSYYKRLSQSAYDFSRRKTWDACAHQYLDFIIHILEAVVADGVR